MMNSSKKTCQRGFFALLFFSLSVAALTVMFRPMPAQAASLAIMPTISVLKPVAGTLERGPIALQAGTNTYPAKVVFVIEGPNSASYPVISLTGSAPYLANYGYWDTSDYNKWPAGQYIIYAELYGYDENTQTYTANPIAMDSISVDLKPASVSVELLQPSANGTFTSLISLEGVGSSLKTADRGFLVRVYDKAGNMKSSQTVTATSQGQIIHNSQVVWSWKASWSSTSLLTGDYVEIKAVENKQYSSAAIMTYSGGSTGIQLVHLAVTSPASGSLVLSARSDDGQVEVDFHLKDSGGKEVITPVGGAYDGTTLIDGKQWYRWKTHTAIDTTQLPDGAYTAYARAYKYNNLTPIVSNLVEFKIQNTVSQTTVSWVSPSQAPTSAVSGQITLSAITNPPSDALDFVFTTPSGGTATRAAQIDPSAPGKFRYDWKTDDITWQDGVYSIVPKAKLKLTYLGEGKPMAIEVLNAPLQSPVSISIKEPAAYSSFVSTMLVDAMLSGTLSGETCRFKILQPVEGGSPKVISSADVAPESKALCVHTFDTSTIEDGSYHLLAEAIDPSSGEAVAQATVMPLLKSTGVPPPLPSKLSVSVSQPVYGSTVSGTVGIEVTTNLMTVAPEVTVTLSGSSGGIANLTTTLKTTSAGSKTIDNKTYYIWKAVWYSVASGWADGKYDITAKASYEDQTAVSPAVTVELDNVTDIPPPAETPVETAVVTPTSQDAYDPFSGDILLEAKASPVPDSLDFHLQWVPTLIQPLPPSNGNAGPLAATLNPATGYWQATWATDESLDGNWDIMAVAELNGKAYKSSLRRITVQHEAAGLSVAMQEPPATINGTVSFAAVTSGAAGSVRFVFTSQDSTVQAPAEVMATATDGSLTKWVADWDSSVAKNAIYVIRAVAVSGKQLAKSDPYTILVDNLGSEQEDSLIQVELTSPLGGQVLSTAFSMVAKTETSVGNLVFSLTELATGNRINRTGSAEQGATYWTHKINTPEKPLMNGKYRLVARAFTGGTRVGTSQKIEFAVQNPTSDSDQEQAIKLPEGYQIIPGRTVEYDEEGRIKPLPDGSYPIEPVPDEGPADDTPLDETDKDDGSSDSNVSAPSAFGWMGLFLPEKDLSGDVVLQARSTPDVAELKIIVIDTKGNKWALESERVKRVLDDRQDGLQTTSEKWLWLWQSKLRSKRFENGRYGFALTGTDNNGKRLPQTEPVVRQISNQPTVSGPVYLSQVQKPNLEATEQTVWMKPESEKLVGTAEMPEPPKGEGTDGTEQTVGWHPECQKNGIKPDKCQQWLAYQSLKAGDSRCQQAGISLKEECISYLQKTVGAVSQQQAARETAGLIEKSKYERLQKSMFSLVNRTIELKVPSSTAGAPAGQAGEAVPGGIAGEDSTAADSTKEPGASKSGFARPDLSSYYQRWQREKKETTINQEDAETELADFIPLKSKRDRKVRLHASQAYVENSEGLIQSQMPALVMLDDDGDGLPNGTEQRLGTDPLKADTDGDGYGDLQEIESGFDPLVAGGKLGATARPVSPVDAAIISGVPLDQPKASGQLDERLRVSVVESFDQGAVSGMPALRLSGVAEPGETLTIYLYSYLPLVLTTTAKEDGTWTYDLTDSITDGEHVAYVAVNDETGRIKGKSQPLPFLVAEAKAATEEEYFSPTVMAAADAPVNRFMVWYLVGAGMLILGGVVIGGLIFTRAMRKHQDSY